MAERETSGVKGRAIDGSRLVLLSNAAKARTSELNHWRSVIKDDGLSDEDLSRFIHNIFDTLHLYVDMKSRHAVEDCIVEILRRKGTTSPTDLLIELSVQEANKKSLGPGSAFVLVRWLYLLLPEIGKTDEAWTRWGTRTIHAIAAAADTFYTYKPREGVHRTVLRVLRRAFRRLLASKARSTQLLDDTVTTLTAKANVQSPRNAFLLGILAGTCSRLPELHQDFKTHTLAYNEYYIRELLGSRSVLSDHHANAMAPYFQNWVSRDNLEKDIIPSAEKALLRAPEIVLVNILPFSLKALSEDIDLAPVLASKLANPLLKSSVSTNASIRAGAIQTFTVLAQRSRDKASIAIVADIVLKPLAQGKVTSADHRASHASLLRALPDSVALSAKIPQGLSTVLSKESNDTALAAEVSAFTKPLVYGLLNNVSPEKPAVDVLIKGLSDKKLQYRRIWTLQLVEALRPLSDSQLQQSLVTDILDQVLPKLVETWNEAQANPLAGLTSGLVPAACAATSLLVRASATNAPRLQCAQILAKADIASKSLNADAKSSFLSNAKVYTKLVAEEDSLWCLRALISLSTAISSLKPSTDSHAAWGLALTYFVVAGNVASAVRAEATTSLQQVYASAPATISTIMLQSCVQWAHDLVTGTKDSPASAASEDAGALNKIIKALHAGDGNVNELELEEQARAMLIVVRPEIIPGADWIHTCLRLKIDPGQLASKNADNLLDMIRSWISDPKYEGVESFQAAAYAAAADLAFVSPEVMLPRIVEEITADLDVESLKDIGPTEAAIFRTPPGIAFIDVLATKAPAQPPSKNSKDYDTLKWEAELRESLAQKKGQSKKLTRDEQVKVDAQLTKEAEIRKDVAAVVLRLQRGCGYIRALLQGPPTDSVEWFGRCTQALFDVLVAGAGLLIGQSAAETYLLCSSKTSARLGAMRSFVGAVALRAAGVVPIPSYVEEEPLGDAMTRILHRLRFMGEQRPFDPVSLSYALHAIFIVLEEGAVERSGEDADEQLVLAGEFLSLHTDICRDTRLPRRRILSAIIKALQKYTGHFRLFKDCLNDMSRGIAANLSDDEADVMVKAVIVPQSAVRTAALQAISAELDLSHERFIPEIWLASHDDLQENVELGVEIWEENELQANSKDISALLQYLESTDGQLRRATAKSIAALVQQYPDALKYLLQQLQETYCERAKPRLPQRDKYGMPMKVDLEDPWCARHGVALTFEALSPLFKSDNLVPFFSFLAESGPLADKVPSVREAMLEAATKIVAQQGGLVVEELMALFEKTLDGPDSGSQAKDLVNEAVVILYGALARHLDAGDSRIPAVVQRLLQTLSTPSESVQYAVAQCLPPLVQASSSEAAKYIQQMLDDLLTSKKYAARRGAAYGLAGIVKGRGISALREKRVLSNLKAATENKKDANQRQGVYLAYELLSLILGRVFEPYVIQIVPQLLAGFADTSADVREACLDAAKTCFSTLSSFGVKQILPTLLDGLDDSQWRSKKGACDSLGAMAYLDPEQLAISLPLIIPPLTEVLNDSHKEVRASANRSLQRFGEVISNPEIKSQVNILLKALSDPTRFTDEALDALIRINFLHALDAPSLALVVRVLERGLGDRSATKRKASQIIGSLAHLTDRKDLTVHLPMLVAGLRTAVVDPVPATRATASKALGSTVEKLGEDALPDLIPSLMNALKSDTGAGDRLGSAQALSEVLAGLGTSRLEETLPTILQHVSSSRATVREGFMSLFIFLPATFGNSFANYLSKVIPPILAGLADEIESIRETALRAGRLLVKNFATRAIDLLLPELERGLADDSYRIRLSSVELVGDLLFNLTGISATTEQDETEEDANEAGQSLLEVLGEEKRNKVLSALYICRNDTSGLVRAAAINVWKALVSTPRTLRELVPTLTQLLIRRLASSNMEQKVIAGTALGELIRKAGENVLATLLPTLEEGLQTSTDTNERQGICIALKELISAAAEETLEDHEKTLISVVRTALVDPDEDVREAAAEAFDSLQRIFGKKAIDQVLPYLLSLLRSEDGASNALSALLTLLTEQSRANVILPNLLPTLLTSPISAFNAKALASLAEVAGSSMTRRLPNIINALMDAIVTCKDDELKTELDTSLDTVLLSVDEYDGLNSLMSVMLGLVKHNDHMKRAAADYHLAHFFTAAEMDYSRFHPDLIRSLLLSFDDRDPEVVKAAWTGLSALTSQLKKEEMEGLVASSRQAVNQVGVAGHPLPGFGLPKGINAILPIFLQGLMNGTAEQRTQAALAISDVIDRTSPDALKPFVTQITGPLIRVVSERSTDVKCAILLTLNNLLEKIPTFLKPFLPQLQRTFAKSLADPSSELLRTRAAKALGTLITLTPRVDPLIAELVTGSKTSDTGVRNAMLKALYEVVSKAGSNMNEASRTAILGLIDSDTTGADENAIITNARLLGALVAVLPADAAAGLVKNRVLTTHFTYPSVLALNATLASSPEALTAAAYAEILSNVIAQAVKSSNPQIADNGVLAAGKYLLTDSSMKDEAHAGPIVTALKDTIAASSGSSIDTRRLSLIVLRAAARHDHDALVSPYLSTLIPVIFGCVRDPVIPIKLAAEQAFLALFEVADVENERFDAYLAGDGSDLPPNVKRSMTDYFKRVALRLGAQTRERREAEGKGQRGAEGGATADEEEDEREIWSVGRVEIGEVWREG